MIRLILGLSNEGLAKRFGVLPTQCSYVFTTWIRLLSKALVVWPPMESIKEHLLEIFLKSGYGKCRGVIIDCADVVIERPKSLSAQAVTWSSTIIHLKFWLELNPLCLFCSSLLVMRVKQATGLSPEVFSMFLKGMIK